MLNKLNSSKIFYPTSDVTRDFTTFSEMVKFTEAQKILKANNLDNSISKGSENTCIIHIGDKDRIIPYSEIFSNTKKVVKYIRRHS